MIRQIKAQLPWLKQGKGVKAVPEHSVEPWGSKSKDLQNLEGEKRAQAWHWAERRSSD